jgi:hypothetical protein
MAIGAQAPAGARLDGTAGEETFREISRSVARLSGELRAEVRWMARPGVRPPTGLDEILARAGIEALLTCAPGLNAPGDPRYALRTVDASRLHLEGGFDSAVFDAGIAGIPGTFRAARRGPGR